MVDIKSVLKKWDYQKSISKFKDTKNFEIQKQGRFAARFFQMTLAIILYYWIAVQKQSLVDHFQLGQVNGAIYTFSYL
jgi:hypothetical protein